MDHLREFELAPEPAGLFVVCDEDELVFSPVKRPGLNVSAEALSGASVDPLTAVVAVEFDDAV